jgi:hypothetical protein
MSAREQLAPDSVVQVLLAQRLDDRALRILTDGNNHAPRAIHWALGRNPFMASFKESELALGAYEVHRT